MELEVRALGLRVRDRAVIAEQRLHFLSVVHLLPEPSLLALPRACPPDLGHRLAARFAMPPVPHQAWKPRGREQSIACLPVPKLLLSTLYVFCVCRRVSVKCMRADDVVCVYMCMHVRTTLSDYLCTDAGIPLKIAQHQNRKRRNIAQPPPQS